MYRVIMDPCIFGYTLLVNHKDWKSGYNFQKMETLPQPGSLESEAGIFCSTFDKTGLRLITGEADKSIKVCYLLMDRFGKKMKQPHLKHIQLNGKQLFNVANKEFN